MNYLEELKNRSIFLWRVLFDGGTTADETRPVYIDRASVPDTGTDAQKTDRSASATGAEKTELNSTEERDSSIQRKESVNQNVFGPDAAPKQGKAETAPMESILQNVMGTESAAASAGEMASDGKESETVSQESVLQGITDAELAAQSARQPELTDEEPMEQSRPMDQGIAVREKMGTGSTVLPDAQKRADDFAASGAEELLQRIRTATRSGIAAERSISRPETGSPIQTEREQAAGPADVSAWFEKDARRYDGAYELM